MSTATGTVVVSGPLGQEAVRDEQRLIYGAAAVAPDIEDDALRASGQEV
jgi:hypothetical protein